MIPDWRARVLSAVVGLETEMVQSLQALIREPSVGGSDAENQIQATLGGQLDGLGLDVDRWSIDVAATEARADFPGSEVNRAEAFGLVGARRGRGDGPALMINAHVDVVPAGPDQAWGGRTAFSGEADGRAVHGRGACDMKAGLVAGLFALRAIQQAGVPLHGDLLLACVQGEEDGGLGTYSLLQRGHRADACVIPEPTGLDLVPANAGALTFRLTVPGLATHASRRLEGISAIGKLFPIWMALLELEAERNTFAPPLLQRWELPYPICLGSVHSGVWASSVPDLLVAEGRIGVALGEDVQAARAALENAVADACRLDPWLCDHQVTVQWWGGQFASAELAGDHPLIAGTAAAHQQVTGSRPEVWGATYGSDLRLLLAAGIPTLQYGPGDAALAHGPREQVPVAELVVAAQTLAVLALEHCGVG